MGVAVSGGIDSVALLRLLLELRGELGIVLSVVHFNHKLRGDESDADQEFVANLARAYDLEFHADSDDVAQNAAEERVSVETAAREMRYGFFRYLLGEGSEPQGLKPDPLSGANGTAEAVPFHETLAGAAESRALSKPLLARLNKIATGHTLDDQAETVLMRLIRGSGLRGLGGIHPRIPVEDEGDSGEAAEIIRPLLAIRHRELERYLHDLGQSWREDSTNADAKFTRNRVRKLVLPLLEQEFNPAVAANLAELAEIARGEEDYWDNESAGWLGTTVRWTEPQWARESAGLVQITPQGNAPHTPDLQERIDQAPWLVMNASVSRMWFLGEPLGVQRRLVKAIGENAGIPLEFKHVEEIVRGAAEAGPHSEFSLPLGWKLVLEPEELIFLTPDLRDPAPQQDYEYAVPVPGRIIIVEAGSSLELRRVPDCDHAGYNPDQLLDAESLPGPLRVRNWRPGDRFWPAHTKSPKKIKDLLQEHHVAQPLRKSWPVLVSCDEIVWVRGFPLPAKFRPKPDAAAVLLLDEPLDAT